VTCSWLVSVGQQNPCTTPLEARRPAIDLHDLKDGDNRAHERVQGYHSNREMRKPDLRESPGCPGRDRSNPTRVYHIPCASILEERVRLNRPQRYPRDRALTEHLRDDVDDLGVRVARSSFATTSASPNTLGATNGTATNTAP